MKRVIVDTGPIVALLNRADKHHAWTRTVLDDVEPPMATCEAVVSAACFLLRRTRGAQDAVLELVARGVVSTNFSISKELSTVRKLMDRHSSVPMTDQWSRPRFSGSGNTRQLVIVKLLADRAYASRAAVEAFAISSTLRSSARIARE